MIRKLVILAGILFMAFNLTAQVAVATDGNPPHPAAMLDIRSTTKGLLIPRMTTAQREAMPGAPGLVVYDTNTGSFWFWQTIWREMTHTGNNLWLNTGATIASAGSQTVVMNGNATIAGNLAFQLSNPTLISPSFLQIPGGAFFSDKPVWFTSQARFRGGIANDFDALLTINGGTAGHTFFTGRVGIMNNNPITPLDITGGNWDLVNSEGDIRVGSPSYRLKIGVATGGGGAGAVTLMQYGQTGGLNVLSLGSQGNNVLYVNGNTNAVGIHNNVPHMPLSFQSSVGGKISLYGSSSTNHYGLGIQGGLLQIHTDVNGSNIAFGYGSSTNFTTRMILFTGSGNLHIAGSLVSNAVFAPSDIALKKDITSIENGLETIGRLQGYTYHWKNEDADPSLQSGVLAQEVESVLPNLVQKNENGTLMVNYTGLIPYLIQGVKEQQAEIDSLKKELKELKEMVKKSLN